MDSVNYRVFKTTTGEKFRMRVSEDEKFERQLFHVALILVPLVTVFGFAAAAGMI